MIDKISIRGASEHNLKHIDLDLPKNSLIVITGISGSGKSSLAFDTIYAEGQRRYVESLSAYARQFLGLMEKPDVDQIEGLSPAISIDQKSASHNPRSTVGTITEIYDYMRLLWARIGHPHCPIDGKEISAQSTQEIVDQLQALPKSKKILLLAPIVKGRKGIYEEVFIDLKKKGFVRVRVDGKAYEIDEVPALDRYKIHDIEVVVDRLILPIERQRLTESVEVALRLGEGLTIINIEGEKDRLYSEKFACPEHDISLPELEPRTFSFNSPHGACAACSGLGTKLTIDADLVIPNKSLSISEGAILPWSRTLAHDSWTARRLEGLAEHLNFSLSNPIEKLPKDTLEKILYGSAEDVFNVSGRNRFGRHISFNTTFEGVIPELLRRHSESESDWVKREIEKYMREEICEVCGGDRLKKETLFVTIKDKSIVEVSNFSISAAADWFEKLEIGETEFLVAKQILKEIKARLKFLTDVGLDYLTINRTGATLAGGEAQRIRLASQIGSGLSGVLYVLDEPSIGLHQKDNAKLVSTLRELKELGNTVIVVEHDEETIRAADWVVDIGPGAGEAGGEVIAQGTPEQIASDPNSITGQFLAGKRKVAQNIVLGRKNKSEKNLKIVGATEHNLKNITVEIPLGKFVCITGVSGSGKSSLIWDILYKALAERFYRAKDRPGKFASLEGVENIDKVIAIDQSPIGRTPRSNPATYTGAFGAIRDIFAQTPEARSRGYQPGRFSFNVRGGRCENCQGDGVIKVEMQFLPDVYVTCEVCGGQRYNREALEVLYKGKNISQVLNMTTEEAFDFFENIPQIAAKLKTLVEVGLGYIRLGQSATTLSGGEAQRVKLATELSRRSTGGTIYILDEPTTGLHFADIDNLLLVLHRLVEAGNTVIIIEHNLDVIKTADWIVDLGPDGGDRGGEIVSCGTPEQISQDKDSYTGAFLKKVVTTVDLKS
ncbi:MAG: excinuclease ABC subunit A [Candidatus Woykebacteria bacterium RIFCSPHIGHO2_12_FULL_45_10]|uniref:UvrABC system protein A n=1 Tax=Candidatus Woykebacteria bacterium RIFCSPHIGHO2_12_FULL_45_10 TaxID=1802603 RepID=A0A1G1WMX9_9BACT|nr:MAG: excinuclease ABC subunit A [Candidatus Woykebacteria bacterium RIFCSPHIGHO2_12_FULL_45_10]